MNSMRKVAGLAARIAFGLVVLIGALALLAIGGFEFTGTSAKTQGQGRVVTKRPWLVEPVKVISARTKKKGKVEIGKEFDEDDDWLDGFTITVRNGSNKIVTALAVELVFRRESGDTRPPFAKAFYFGPSPIDPAYNRRNPNKIIEPGETIDFEVGSQVYARLKETLQRLGYPNSINRVELVITEVGFDDGSVLLSGTLWVQDPDNPNDPTKKVRPEKVKPPRPRHHTIGNIVKRPNSTNTFLTAVYPLAIMRRIWRIAGSRSFTYLAIAIPTSLSRTPTVLQRSII